MPYVMELWELSSIGNLIPGSDGARYLLELDVDAFNGIGHVYLTLDINKAKRFATLAEVFEEWKRQSNKIPLRPDGKPNRPLTAYNMSPLQVK